MSDVIFQVVNWCFIVVQILFVISAIAQIIKPDAPGNREICGFVLVLLAWNIIGLLHMGGTL